MMDRKSNILVSAGFGIGMMLALSFTVLYFSGVQFRIKQLYRDWGKWSQPVQQKILEVETQTTIEPGRIMISSKKHPRSKPSFAVRLDEEMVVFILCGPDCTPSFAIIYHPDLNKMVIRDESGTEHNVVDLLKEIKKQKEKGKGRGQLSPPVEAK